MLNPESQTMREFSLTTTTKNGDAIKVLFGYDTSANHSGYYLSASINGSKPSSDAKTLKRIKSLGIPVFQMISEFIGYDVTGAPYNMDETAVKMLTTGCDLDTLSDFYHIDTQKEYDALISMVEKFDTTKGEKQRLALVSRFGNSLRLRMIEQNRTVIREIREFYLKGIDLNGKHLVPCFEGILRLKHNPLYFKRDMDYIRKARVRLFKNVLKRSYKPF